ncbi:MAG: aromatic aminobenezylarsenical efflux permease ArsG family transporter [Oligosphaeraceae bacterium]
MPGGAVGELVLAGWLGLLCSVSPCPLAGNVAAVGFLSRRVCGPWRVLAYGALFALGRSLAYVLVGVVLLAGMAAAPTVALMLQKYMNLLLGPLLVVVSMSLLGLLRGVPEPSAGGGDGGGRRRLVERLASGGWMGALLLGMVLALSFCPTSAALFFGELLPLMVSSPGRSVALGMSFGVMSGLPVLVCAVALAFFAGRLGRAFGCLAAVEVWLRRVTGWLFLGLGVWLTCRVTLGL